MRTPVQFSLVRRLVKNSRVRLILLSLVWIVLEPAMPASAEPIASLHPTNYVNDFAGVLNSATVTRLNDLCLQVEQKAHAQIAVVTVKSVDGQDVVHGHEDDTLVLV